ncbi:MAG: alpha-amylase family glycosyl hydrolase [Nitriliruptoraceae bacterium]
MTAARSHPLSRPAWWSGAVGYEVYVRSFADDNGDGIGDLPGVRARLPHLADLGVDVVWLTPITPSPQRDHGYDVADYLGVEPDYGTLDDLTALLDDAHELGLKVLLDLVPNHTSDQHPWFLDSRASRDAEHRDFYVWRDPAPDGGPPNNWVSHFGGPAWTLDERTGQYYMHLFLPEQPDLNWGEPRVRAAFEDILTTWFQRGVDGVRIDVAHSLVEDPHLRDNPELEVPPDGDATSVFDRFAHIHDLDQPGVVDIYRDWRRLADAYDAVLLGEVYVLDPGKLQRYVADDALHSAFAFDTIRVAWDAEDVRTRLAPYVTACGNRLAWPLSSHDDPHAATRFGGGEQGARRALAYLTLLSALPGVPFLFQGDELGLEDGDVPPAERQDPIAERIPGATGRDGARTPMPWTDGPGLGFTTGEPWLPIGRPSDTDRTVAAQLGDPTSQLERTRRLLEVRRGLPALTGDTPLEWVTEAGPVVAVTRDDAVLAALHVADGEGEAVLELPETARLVYATDDATRLVDGVLTLPEDAAVLVVLDGDEGTLAAAAGSEEVAARREGPA